MPLNSARNTLSPCFFKLLLVTLFLVAGLARHTPGQAQTDTAAHNTKTPYAVLADLLENPETRDQLIHDLRTKAPQAGSSQPQRSAAESRSETGRATQTAADAHVPAVMQLASTLQHMTRSLTNDLASASEAIKTMARGRLPSEHAAGARGELGVLAVAVLATLASYLVLRLIAGLFFGRLNRWIRADRPHTAVSATTLTETKESAASILAAPTSTPSSSGAPRPRRPRRTTIALSRKLLGVSAALGVDLAATVLASLTGYLAIVIAAGYTQDATGFALQFLTAFVMIEAAKALSRGVFATRYEQLRLLPLNPETARYWNRWLTLLMGMTGYCLLIVVPVTQSILLPAFGHLLGLLIMLGVYVYGVRVVWSHRKAVKEGLAAWSEKSSTALLGTLIRILSRLWHLLAIAYLTVLFIASQAEQQLALAFMVRATVQSALAIVAGTLLAAALSSLLEHRIAVPDSWKKALPLLEPRLNSYVPAALKGLRLLIAILTTLIVLDAWHAFDLGAWLNSDGGRAIIAILLRVGVVLMIAALSWTIIASIIEHRLGAGTLHRRASEREKTLLMLFRNAAAVVIVTMTILIVLSQIGINIGPLIAGAGVAGLAIGFGAQKLVQDVITGLFIQLENGMNQNDIVEVVGLFGTVEKITIRSVVIRTLDGGYHLIPFSSIDKLSNHTRDYGYHYAEYNIAHRENVDEAIAQMELAYKDLMQDAELAPEVLEEISIPGVTALNERGFSIRVLIKTTPGNQWAIQRGYNRLLKQRFDAAGIELPYPQSVLHFGRDKSGYASPVDVRAVDSLRQFTAAKSAAR